MGQTTLCVPLEVKPESCPALCAIIERWKLREDKSPGGDNFARVKRDIPTAHFLSISVFPAHEYDPLCIIEANFDGPSGVFWGQMEAAFGGDLRDMLRCCKKPLDDQGPLWEAVTGDDAAPLAPYLEARTQRPSVFHHGNRGMSRDRILGEAELFEAAQKELDDPGVDGASRYRGVAPGEVHRRLRQALLGRFGWLGEAAPERFPLAERIGDLTRLVVFASVVLFALSLPGFVLALVLPRAGYAVVTIVLAVVLGGLAFILRRPMGDTGVPTSFRLTPVLLRNWLMLTGLLAAYVVAAPLLSMVAVTFANGLLTLFGAGRLLDTVDAGERVTATILWGLFGVLVSVPFLLLWLRWLERRDSSHDAPHVNEQTLREIVRREDWIAQNHMGSIVLVKPGVLRTALIRTGHLGLGLLLRVTARDGYLGSMRTVHFAHWAFLNNGSRLLFFSNFDHSWDSYLDDFIEKAHAGLTLAWGSGVGFPPARFLIFDGASHGRQFKNWALASRAVSRFWYSAYRHLTVDQIERNNRIATGLRRPDLTAEEAGRWLRDL